MKPSPSIGQRVVQVGAALTMLDVVASRIRRPIDAAYLTGRSIVGLYRLALTADPVSARVAAVEDDAERFKVAAREAGRSARDLPALERQLWRGWACGFIGFCVTLAASIIFVHAIHRAVPFLGPVAVFAAALALGVHAMSKAYFHWQVRNRRLGRFQEFWARPEEWLPPGSVAQSRSIASILVLAIGGMILVPAAAYAATPASADMAQQLLEAILPGGLGGPGNPFTRAIGIMTSGICAAAGAMFAYHSMLVTSRAAMAGTVWKEQINTTWAPIQVVVGVGMLLPVLGSGLSGIHGVVGTLAAGSIKTTNSIWVSFVEDVLRPEAYETAGGRVPALDVPVPLGGMELAQKILVAEVCQKFYVIMRRVLPGASIPPLPETSGSIDGNSRVWSYGDACGGLSISMAAADATKPGKSLPEIHSEARVAAVGKLIADIRASGLVDNIVAASVPAGMGADLLGPAAQQPWPKNIASTLKPYAAAYEVAVKKAAADYMSKRDRQVRQRLIEQAKLNGWMAAGAYWRVISQVGSEVVSLASEAPAVSGPDLSTDWTGLPDPNKGLLGKSLALMDETWRAETHVQRLRGQDLAAVGDGEHNYLNDIVSKSGVADTINKFIADPSDPQRRLQNLGHGMMLAGEIGIVAGGGIALLTGNAAGKLVGLKAVFDWFGDWARLIIAGCIGIGWALAYLLPMMPFLAVLWLAVGWFIFLAECMIAAPIFVLLFIRLDGTAFIDATQRPGAILLFNLFFRPILGILGLIAAYYTLPLTTGMLSLWFAEAYVGQQGGSFVAVGGLLGGIAFLCYCTFQVHSRTLDLVHSIPDRLPRWFGLGAEGFGERENQNTTVAAVVGGSNRAGSSAASGGKSSQPKGNDKNDKSPGGGGIQKTSAPEPK